MTDNDILDKDDGIQKDIDNWKMFILGTEKDLNMLRQKTGTGRPYGNSRFLERLKGYLRSQFRRHIDDELPAPGEVFRQQPWLLAGLAAPLGPLSNPEIRSEGAGPHPAGRGGPLSV